MSKTLNEKNQRDLFLQGAALDKEYLSPHELELFELETKMRKVLLELL